MVNSQKWDGTPGREGIKVLARETRRQSHCGMPNRFDDTVSHNLVKELILLCKLVFSRLTICGRFLGPREVRHGLLEARLQVLMASMIVPLFSSYQ